MSEQSPLLVKLEAGILTLSINDAPINRMSFEYMDALEEAVMDAATNPEGPGAGLYGRRDQNFSVGMDLKQLGAGAAARGGAEAVFDQRLRVLAGIEDMTKPSIATLFGYCLGRRPRASTGLSFQDCGHRGSQNRTTGNGSGRCSRMGRDCPSHALCGPGCATLDMILRAKKIDGPEALRIGLVQEIHPLKELKAAAHAMALELASMPPIAVAGVLRCVVGAGSASLEDALAAERAEVMRCFSTEDQREGMLAFLEKRRPVFKGR